MEGKYQDKKTTHSSVAVAVSLKKNEKKKKEIKILLKNKIDGKGPSKCYYTPTWIDIP